MNKKVIFVGAHPDDETIGCGGSILKYQKMGFDVAWLLLTNMHQTYGFKTYQVNKREQEIKYVLNKYQIKEKNFWSLGFEPSMLDNTSIKSIYKKIECVFHSFMPNIVFLPHPGDAHSDHLFAFKASAACTKWFRFPSIKKVLTYETLSETESGLDLSRKFIPNCFVDITSFLKKKFPFPRSLDAIEALAKFRGCQSGFYYAEAFCVLVERI